MQLAMDPPDLLIRVPHNACMFYEFWRASELIERGREIAETALDDFEAA
jgi:NTE family protein